jgi:type VI secretion system protein
MGFLEKLLGPLPGSAQRSPVRWVGDPIRNHLMLLLNTRRGSLGHIPEYGMPDVASYYSDYPTSLSYLRSEIMDLIRRFEPRLSDVNVRLIASDEREFRVSLLISGEVEEPDGVVKVSYRTTISSDGKAELE